MANEVVFAGKQPGTADPIATANVPLDPFVGTPVFAGKQAGEPDPTILGAVDKLPDGY